jgi:diguanylate cyclase (GGDEF)-like protein/PAS domain S-box-containing protein
MIINLFLVLLLCTLAWISFGTIRKLKTTLIQHEEIASLFENSPVAMMVLNSGNRIVQWNEAAHHLFGYTRSEALGRDILDLIVPLSDRAHVAAVLLKALKEHSSHSKNFNITKDKEELFCQWHHRHHNETIICTAQDITSSKKAVDDLTKRSTALESSGEAILYTNHKGLIEFANRSFFTLCPSDQNTILNTHIGDYIFGSVQAMNAILPQFDANNTWKGTLRKNSSGVEKVFSVVLTAIYNRNRLMSYIANLHDITKISEHVHSLTHQAYHDPLTGATNRSAMNERLVMAIDHAKATQTTVALFFIDLNGFKLINDTHGHEVGDKLLSSVASNLHACLRNSDTIARFGGDEFVIIIEDIKNKEHIETVYKAIQAAINEPIVINSTLVLTAKASIGIAQYPEDAADADSLLKAADEQMYIAKKHKNGGNVCD